MIQIFGVILGLLGLYVLVIFIKDLFKHTKGN